MNLHFTFISAYVTFVFCSFLKLMETQTGSQKAPKENQNRESVYHQHGVCVGGAKVCVSLSNEQYGRDLNAQLRLKLQAVTSWRRCAPCLGSPNSFLFFSLKHQGINGLYTPMNSTGNYHATVCKLHKPPVKAMNFHLLILPWVIGPVKSLLFYESVIITKPSPAPPTLAIPSLN